MANTTIRLKKSGVVSNVPASLELGELALNYADGKLYYKNADGLITYISSGASTNSFATINANSSLIIATSNTDILSLTAANNITITADGIGKTITIGSLLTDALYVNSSSIGASANAVYTVYTLAQATRDGLNYTSNVAADAYTFAGNAYNKANSAAITAQAAFDKANSGGAFVNVDYLTIEKQLYTANASQTNFFAHYTPPFVTVVINGATIDSSEYSTATANTIILNNPASAGDIVDITAFTTFNSNTFIGGIGTDPVARNTANNALANTTGIFAGDLTTTGNIIISSTESSLSSISGALKVAGGVGVAGNVYADKIFVNGLFWAANGNVISTGGSTTASSNTLTIYTYVASNNQNTFSGLDTSGKTLSYTPGILFTTLNGITLTNGVDYTATNGTSINLSFNAAANDEVVIYTFGAFSVANTYTIQQSDVKFTTAGKSLAMNFFRS